MMNQLQSAARWCVALGVLVLAAACQAPPTAPSAFAAGLSAQQKQVLREQGFEPTDDGWELQMSGKLLFDVNSEVLDAPRRANLALIGGALHAAGIDQLRVEGHTDDQGRETYNEQLSLRRARVVAQVLAEAGIPADHMVVQGFGFSRPVVRNASESARKENRRVAIVIPVH